MILTTQAAKLRALINKAPGRAGADKNVIALWSLTSTQVLQLLCFQAPHVNTGSQTASCFAKEPL